MILKEVRDNKIKSFFIVLGFIFITTLVVYFVCYYLDLGPYSLVIALSYSIISSLINYYNCDKLVLAMNNARPANEEEDRLLTSVMDGLVIASGLPKPRLYVVDDPSPNAFATGRNPENAVVCVTTGLLEIMDKYELEGVLAHELSHIKNYDILLSTVISVFAGFIVMVSDFVLRFGFGGRRRNSDDRESNPLDLLIVLLGLVFLIFSPLVTRIIQLAVSRNREFLADATSVEFTRNPNGLINALKKLNSDTSSMQNISNATAHMYINDPDNRTRRIKKASIFSTHPSIEERIARLEHIN